MVCFYRSLLSEPNHRALVCSDLLLFLKAHGLKTSVCLSAFVSCSRYLDIVELLWLFVYHCSIDPFMIFFPIHFRQIQTTCKVPKIPAFWEFLIVNFIAACRIIVTSIIWNLPSSRALVVRVWALFCQLHMNISKIFERKDFSGSELEITEAML